MKEHVAAEMPAEYYIMDSPEEDYSKKAAADDKANKADTVSYKDEKDELNPYDNAYLTMVPNPDEPEVMTIQESNIFDDYNGTDPQNKTKGKGKGVSWKKLNKKAKKNAIPDT